MPTVLLPSRSRWSRRRATSAQEGAQQGAQEGAQEGAQHRAPHISTATHRHTAPQGIHPLHGLELLRSLDQFSRPVDSPLPPRRSHAAPSRPLSRHPVDECPYSSPCQLQVATVASWLPRRDWLARLCPVDTTTHNVACALHPPPLPSALPIAHSHHKPVLAVNLLCAAQGTMPHSHPNMTTISRPGSCKQPSCLIRQTRMC
jgi:hypothetical protein